MPLTYVQTLSAKSPLINGGVGWSNKLTADTVILGASDFPSGSQDGAFYVFDRVPATTKYSYVIGISATLGSNIILGCSNDLNSSFIYSGAPNFNSGQGIVYEYKNTAPGRFGLISSITSTARNRKGYLGAKIKLIDATSMYISAPTAETTTTGAQRGAVHLYDKTSGTWTWSASISTNDSSNLDNFGFSFDGTASEIIVGSPGWNGNTGAAYLFNPGGDPKSYTNTQQIKLLPSVRNGPWQGNSGSRFGIAIAVGTNYLVIGAPGQILDTQYGPADIGAAFLYVRDGILWTYASILTADVGVNNQRAVQFGRAVAINESNNTALVGCFLANDQGIIYGFDISNPSSPKQTFIINTPLNTEKSDFGCQLDILTSTDNGILLAGNPGAIINPDDGSVFPARCGGALLFNGINEITPTPTPSPTPPTPSPTPQPTPVIKPVNWYGLNSLDPISVGDGGGTPGSNYPKTPALGGPGRNYSILRELGALYVNNPGIYNFSSFRGSLKNLAIAYNGWCLNYGLIPGDTTAMSEFHRSRGISLAFSYILLRKQVTRTKYCDRTDGGVILRLPFYSGQNRYGNPIRSTTYTFTVGATSSLGTVVTVDTVNYLQLEVGGLGVSNQNWSIVDNSTGYTRSGTVAVDCGVSRYVIMESQDYKQQFPANPPV